MTKPINHILVKICCMSFKELKIPCSFGKVTSWPQLISEILVIHACLQYVASDWPRPFLHPRCFCLAYHYLL